MSLNIDLGPPHAMCTCVKNGIKQASHPGMVAHAWDPTFEVNLDDNGETLSKIFKKKGWREGHA